MSKIDQCPNCLTVYPYGTACPNCGKPGDMIYCDLDYRHHKRRPKYPRWLLAEMQRHLEFAYPFNDPKGPLSDRHYNERQRVARQSYVMAFLNGADLMRPYFNAFNTIDEMTSNYKTGDGTKIGRINKVISNLKKKANE